MFSGTIPDPLKDYDSGRNLFIRQSVNDAHIFNCMFKLKTEKEQEGCDRFDWIS